MDDKTGVGLFGVMRQEFSEMKLEIRNKWTKYISKWNKKNLCRWLEILVALFLILDCNSIYRWWKFPYSWYAIPIAFGLCMLILLQYKESLKTQTNVKKQLLTVGEIVAFMLVYTAFTAVATNSLAKWLEMMYIYICIPALFLVYWCFYDYKRLFQAYVDVMCVLAALSLVFLAISYLFPDFAFAYENRIHWGNSTWRNYCFLFYLNADVNVLGLEIKRNLGIFTEPPMHSLNLSIALLLQLFMVQHKNHWKVLLLSITIISAMSSTGLLLLIFLGLYHILYFESGRSDRTVKQAMWFRIRVYIIVAIMVYGALLLRMVTINDTGGTITVRMEDYIAGIQGWLESPFLGHGFANEEAIFRHFHREWNFGLSNSPVSVLNSGGLMLAAIYMVPFILYVRRMLKKHMYSDVAFGMFFLYLFMTTIFPYTYVISFMIAFMLYRSLVEDAA